MADLKYLLLYISILLLSFIPLNEGGYKWSTKKKSKTVSCGSSGTRCTCDDKAYEVFLGTDDLGYDYDYSGPWIKDGEDDVFCYDYTIARTEEATDRCSDETLDSIIIGINPDYEDCGSISCSAFKSMIHSAYCECDCGSNCCDWEYDSGSYILYIIYANSKCIIYTNQYINYIKHF